MDTVIMQRTTIERTATSAAGVIIAFVLLLSQTLLISAKDIEIGNCTGITPAINYIKAEQIKRETVFNQNIKAKYSNCRITDIDKGVKHIRMVRYFNGKPVKLNIIELSTNVNDNLKIIPTIASNTNHLAARTKITEIAKRENAIVAINGGYFKPQSGVPLGTLMINKKIFTGPIYNRVAMGFSETGYIMDRIKLKAKVKTDTCDINIDNINQPRMLSTHIIVYTPAWGTYSPQSPKYGKQLVVSKNQIIDYTVESSVIPDDGYILIGPEKQLEKLSKAKKITLDIKTSPEWSDAKHIISGGPYLIKNGDIYVDMTAQKLASIGGRNPRTAIGYTKDNHLIMLTADGREGSSVGLTLMELASIMKEYGCVNAMNLDGGGSTVMYVQGSVVNRPAISGGIPLSHSLIVTTKPLT